MFQEKRTLTEFTGILLKGIANVFIHQGEEHSVRIESNQDVAGRIKTEIKNQELEISFYDSIPVWLISFPRLDVHVTVKDLISCRMAGVGRMTCTETLKVNEIQLTNSGVGGMSMKLEAQNIITTLKGVGEIELAGKTVRHDVEISGTGKVNALMLESAEVHVRSKGVGECLVHATGKLDIDASGIGKVKYRGNPEVSSKQSGLGSIERIP